MIRLMIRGRVSMIRLMIRGWISNDLEEGFQ